MISKQHLYLLFIIVTRVTGITETLLRTEQPLSVVLPLFITWIDAVVQQVSDATSVTHFPGMATHST